MIDAGNIKKALHEADRLVKKQKDFQCAKVLKALALLRLNRKTEAQEILTQVSLTVPTDDPTLQAMTMCYREMGQPRLVSEVYERAVKKLSTNTSPDLLQVEEVMSHLFMSYVREGDFKKQQITANNLYKINNKNPYFFWSVMSTYLQAINSPEQETLLLSLAEKKIDKILSQGKIEAEAELNVYLMILERQKNFLKMLQVLDTYSGKILGNNLDFVSRRKAFLLRDMTGQKLPAFQAFKQLLENNPDQLEYWKEMIDLALQLDSESPEKATYTNQVIDFLRRLTEKSSKKNKLRGPHLAKMSLFYRLKEEALLKNDLPFLLTASCAFYSTAVEMLTNFFLFFGHKPCFYSDVVFLWDLHPSFHDDLRDFLTKSVSLDMKEPPVDEDAMRRHLNILYLRNLLQEDSTSDMEFVLYLLQVYRQCLPFGIDRPTASVMNPSDGYAQLAAHILLDSQEEDVLVLVVVILVQVVKESPANHTMKLLLILVLNRLGCGHWSYSLFQTLDTKYIMSDSLHYIVKGSLFSSGQFSDSLSLTQTASSFYSSICKDSNDMTISCYKYGSFHKIEEIFLLKEQLLNSLEFHTTTLDKNVLEILLTANSEDEVRQVIKDFKILHFPLGKLSDNRDIRVFSNLTSGMQTTLSLWQTWSYGWQCRCIKFRSLVQEILVILNSKSTCEENGVTSKTIDEVEGKVNQLKDFMSSIESQEIPESLKGKAIVGPETPRFKSFVEEGCLTALVSFTLAVYSNSKLASDWHEDLKFLATLAAAPSISVLQVSPFLTSVVNVMEVISICIMMLSISGVKKTKKKNEVWKSLSSTLDSLVQEVEQGLETVSLKLPSVSNIRDWSSEAVIRELESNFLDCKQKLQSVLNLKASFLSKLNK